jgi:hypothetical protein
MLFYGMVLCVPGFFRVNFDPFEGLSMNLWVDPGKKSFFIIFFTKMEKNSRFVPIQRP